MKSKGGASGFLKQVVSLVMSVVKAKSMAVKSKASAVKTRLIIFGLLRNKKVLMSAVSHKIHALLGHHQLDKQGARGGAGAGDEADHDHDDDGAVDQDDSKAVVLYRAVPGHDEDQETAPVAADDDPEAVAAASGGVGSAARRRGMVAETTSTSPIGDITEAAEEGEDDDGYPDLRHSLFDEEEEWYLQGDDGTGSVVELVRNLRGEEEGVFVLEDEIDHVADVFIRRFHRQMRLQKLESFKRFQEMMERSV